MYASDRRCCVCRRDKHIQLHHIDSDRSNTTFDNLAPLCKLCHGDAETTVPFAQNLDEESIRHYRDEWYAKIEAERSQPVLEQVRRQSREEAATANHPRHRRAELTVVFDADDPDCLQNRATHPDPRQRDCQWVQLSWRDVTLRAG